MEITEVADQKITAKPAETGRCQANTPGRSKSAAADQLFDEVAAFIKNRHGACTQRGAGLCGVSRGRIGHVNVTAAVRHVKGKTARWRRRPNKRAEGGV